jgi:hypothetical protein
MISLCNVIRTQQARNYDVITSLETAVSSTQQGIS